MIRVGFQLSHLKYERNERRYGWAAAVGRYGLLVNLIKQKHRLLYHEKYGVSSGATAGDVVVMVQALKLTTQMQKAFNFSDALVYATKKGGL